MKPLSVYILNDFLKFFKIVKVLPTEPKPIGPASRMSRVAVFWWALWRTIKMGRDIM